MATTFTAYGGSLFFPGVLDREVKARAKGGKPVNLNQEDVKDEIIAKISNEAMARIFLDSLDNERFGELKSRIENSLAEGGDIYPVDVVDTLTRVQNFSVPKKPFILKWDALAFATTTSGPNGGRGYDRGRGRGGRGSNRYSNAKACYRCGGLDHLA